MSELMGLMLVCYVVVAETSTPPEKGSSVLKTGDSSEFSGVVSPPKHSGLRSRIKRSVNVHFVCG